MRVTVPSLAKLNLDLRVLHKRPDGYHELRTIFQTISLRDTLTIDFDFSRRTQIDLISSIDIEDNLVVRSAKLVLDHLKIKARVRFALSKRIPLGAGLGGGSSNAATVLIALPALAGKRVSKVNLVRIAESLGSDVPFFLYGGTALAVGRGTELYPLPDQPARHAVVIHTGIHVSTPEAYRALNRSSQLQIAGVTSSLTSPAVSPMLGEFQTVAWSFALPHSAASGLDQIPLQNDFQDAVFKMHPQLGATARKLHRAGARPALMTGSGSAIFGVFQTAEEAQSAIGLFPANAAFRVHFVPRRQYESRWRRALGSAAEDSCFAYQFGNR